MLNFGGLMSYEFAIFVKKFCIDLLRNLFLSTIWVWSQSGISNIYVSNRIRTWDLFYCTHVPMLNHYTIPVGFNFYLRQEFRQPFCGIPMIQINALNDQNSIAKTFMWNCLQFPVLIIWRDGEGVRNTLKHTHVAYGYTMHAWVISLLRRVIFLG